MALENIHSNPSELRTAPRFAVDLEITVEIRSSSVRLGSSRRVLLAALLRDVSEGGLGFVAPGRATNQGTDLMERGASVIVSLAVAGRTLSLPGRITWVKSSGGEGQPSAAGVRILSEIADSATRRGFQAWLAGART